MSSHKHCVFCTSIAVFYLPNCLFNCSWTLSALMSLLDVSYWLNCIVIIKCRQKFCYLLLTVVYADACFLITVVDMCRYWCNCSDTGFVGVTCEVEIDECESSPCSHNATCIDYVLVCWQFFHSTLHHSCSHVFILFQLVNIDVVKPHLLTTIYET